MAILPFPKDLQVVDGASFCYQFRRVYNAQIITLSGSGTGTWQIQVGTKLTTALPRSASLDEVQTALRALNSIGPGGVVVSAGTPGSSYRLDWAGTLYGTLQAVVQVVPSANIAWSVARVPFDWTGWTATWRASFNDVHGDPADATILTTLTGTATANGQVIIGYAAPAIEGGTPGSPDPTNGNIAILMTEAFTASLPASFDANPVHRGASHVLMLHKGSITDAVLDGKFSVKREPGP